MLEIRETASIAASCQICRSRILDKFHIKSNLGYGCHYHIDCFKKEYGDIIAQIMTLKSEINPVLVARASKPKPLWRLKRRGKEYKISGPHGYSSAWLGGVMVEGIKLDKLLQTTALLEGKEYTAEIVDHFKVKDILTCRLYYLSCRKITYMGTSRYRDAGNVEHFKKMYLVQGIVNK